MATAENIQANQELSKKLRLEAKFRPKVNGIFSRMLKAHRASVAATGLPLNAMAWLDNWQTLLAAHYAVVQDDFLGTVERSQKSMYSMISTKQEGETDEEAIAAALLLWRSGQSNTQARHITDTSIRNISDAMTSAREVLTEAGEQLTNENMAVTSTAVLRRTFAGRVDSIVMTETQAAAEVTKLVESTALLDIPPAAAVTGTLPVVTATKNWQNVGDAKVRPDHVTANGQIRLLQDAFEVGGERLMFPGDSSLGATPKNTANCRCAAVYRL
jgi:uncharacterized protein with gpF-like domain